MSRADLAAAQAALLAALVDGAPAPAGIDTSRLAIEARSLRAKRRRVLTRLLPAEVHDALGPALPDRLDAWLLAHPRRTGTSMRDDAAAFTATLRADGTLPRSPRRRRLMSAMRHR